MSAAFRHLADAQILDRAAALFARSGEKTSLQDVASAVGLSKAGLLHHFPSKEALRGAVHDHAEGLAHQVLAHVEGLPPGPARDRRAVEVLVDVAFRHPGTVALLLAPATDLPTTGLPSRDPGGGSAAPPVTGAVDAPAAAVLAAFGLPSPPETGEPERAVRVLGALAALAVLTLAAHRADTTATWRPHVVTTCLAALGATTSPDAGRPAPDLRKA